MVKKKAKHNTKHALNGWKSVKKVLSSRPAVFLTGLLLVTGLLALLLTPVAYEGTENSTIRYATDRRDDAGVEMGETKVIEEGKDGQKIVSYTYERSLLDILLGRDARNKTEISSEVVSEPKPKVVLDGTRKWQYMMCSDGSYRYYTDEQFKDRSTGFTSKSSDYCSENNQGQKLGLADNPNGNSNATRPTYVPPSCSVVDIPYKTVYQDVDWLYVGETQEGYGVNGFRYSCSDGSYDSTYAASDKIIYRGTAQRPSSPPTGGGSTPSQDYAAKQKCDSDYSSAYAQLQMAGATNSSAMTQLRTLYSQCLSRAGF